MSVVKDFFEFYKSQPNNPIRVSIATVFVSLNWKPLYYLFWSDKAAKQRIDYFEAETSIQSLLIYPVLIGVMITIIVPFLSLFFTRTNSWPKQQRLLLRYEQEKTLLQKETEVVIARNILSGEKDGSIDRITDEKVKVRTSELEEEIERLRELNLKEKEERDQLVSSANEKFSLRLEVVEHDVDQALSYLNNLKEIIAKASTEELLEVFDTTDVRLHIRELEKHLYRVEHELENRTEADRKLKRLPVQQSI